MGLADFKITRSGRPIFYVKNIYTYDALLLGGGTKM
jgi:hypothetical protein